MQHTIFALATPAGKSGVAVLRISGAQALAIAELFHVRHALTPRMAHYVTLKHPVTHAIIDHALLLYFPAPHSFTGEEVLEIQCHGSKAVIHALTQLILESRLARYAEGGEFTKRALEHGKMDVLQAEALIDLINAETESQRHLALRHMGGEASHHYQRLEENIITARAFTEVHIDFPEDDIPEDSDEQINEKITSCIDQIDVMLSTAKAGRAIREGVQVAIVGLPNAGKSTLLNAIAEKRVAITSEQAGTTRDAISYYKEIGGVMMCFTDTAGLRDTENTIEQEGIHIAKEIIDAADIVLSVFDMTQPINAQWEYIEKIVSRETICIGNKIDLLSADELLSQKVILDEKIVSRETICISAKHQEGITTLLNLLASYQASNAHAAIYVTRERHIQHLTHARQHLHDAIQESDIVLKAQYLIYAATEVGAVLGKIELEKILDMLFSSFCIGK